MDTDKQGDALSHAIECEVEFARDAAVRTLLASGYTFHGAAYWKPPIGKALDFSLIDRLKGRIADLEAEIASLREKRKH